MGSTVESPFQFSVHIEPMIRVLKSAGVGVLLGDNLVPGLWFADDIALLADTPDCLTTAIEVIRAWCYKFRMSVNTAKSGVLVTGSGRATQDLRYTTLPPSICRLSRDMNILGLHLRRHGHSHATALPTSQRS